jgi:hypothetical protein
MANNLEIEPLPSNPEERATAINNLSNESKLVNVLSDKKGNFYATVKTNTMTEIHPTTGLPILND